MSGRSKLPALVTAALAIFVLVLFAALACPSANQGVDRDALSTTGTGPTFNELTFFAVMLGLAIPLYAAIGIVVWRTRQRPVFAALLGALVTAVTPYAATAAQSALYPSAYYYIYPPLGFGTFYVWGLLLAFVPFVMVPAAFITWLAAWIPTRWRPLEAAGSPA